MLMKGGRNINSQEYWRKREEEALKHYIKDEKQYSKEIENIYRNMLDQCQKEIESYYAKYASKENISLAEAKKRISKHDVKAFERKAARYVKDKDFSAKANEELRLYNATMRINRLEMLKANIGLELISGSEEIERFMSKILGKRTEEELQRQAGILGKTIKNNAQKAHAIVNGSFHSGTFSDRIWQYQDLMREELGALLQTGLIQGKNPRALTKDLKKYFIGKDGTGGMRYCMERLMRTELARVQTEAQKQSYLEDDIEEYKFIANGGCCPICTALNGKRFKVSKMMPGENAPPVHPHCRCSTAPFFDRKEFDELLNFIEKGGTEEEWNKLKAQKTIPATTKKHKGLSAKIGGDGVPEHDEPILLQTIDFDDKEKVNEVLTNFEKSAKIQAVETACVITKSGKVYKCFGTKDRVFPDFDLKDELFGAIVSHNHPITETSYSFSGDDLSLFQDFNLEILRGCDEVYTYKFTRDATDVDDYIDLDIDVATVEDYYHANNIDLAKENSIGYRRWKNE